MADALGTTYYPSCMVNLRLRFDEKFVPGVEDPGGLTVGDLVSTPPTDKSAPGELKIFAGQDKEGSHLLGRIPKSASVEIPAYRQAGKFRLTFDYRDLPIDPRLMRAAGVEIYMDTVTADNFAKAIPQTAPAGGVRTSVISVLTPKPENLALQGVVDSWHVSHTASGSEVTIEGRDLIGMCLNAPVTADMIAAITVDSRIDLVINELLSKMQGWMGRVQCLVWTNDWPNNEIPIIGKSLSKDIATPRVRRGATTSAVRVSVGANPDKMNFWDVVTRWCFYVGAVPFFTVMPKDYDEGQPLMTTLAIRPANSLYSQWGATENYLPATPFKGGGARKLGSESFRVRRMVFGRNVEEMTFERKFTGFNLPKLVKVICYNPSSDDRGAERTLTSLYPKKLAEAALSVNAADVAATQQRQQAAREAKALLKGKTAKQPTSRVAPSGEISATDMLPIYVNGITDQQRLDFLAEQIYNEIARGEQGGSVRTRALASFGAGNEDPDLVRLRPGDAINLIIDQRKLSERAPNVSPLTQQYQQSVEELAKSLVSRLKDEKLCKAVAVSLLNAFPKLMNVYRVSNVKLDWSVKSGIAVAFDFHNFIAVRADVTETPTVSPTTGPSRVSTIAAPSSN